ncbi:hypothetical protein XENOCAPTIV_007878, partial [Xenoophorus captivus]
DSDLASVIVALIQVIFTGIAALIMDRAGRKALLIISEPHPDLTWLALASMAIFIAGFAIGWGPIPWLIMSEVIPIRVRGFAGAAVVLSNWGMAFVVTKSFQDMMVGLPWATKPYIPTLFLSYVL